MTLIDLENAIEAALQPLKTSCGVTAIKVVSERVEAVGDLIRAAGTRPPFILLVYGGGELKPVNLAQGIYDHRPVFQLLIGVSQLRSNEEGRLGFYPILARAMAALSGQQLHLNIERISFGNVSMVNWSGQMLIYGVPLFTRFPWVIATEAT
jgi:hypothetical protein